MVTGTILIERNEAVKDIAGSCAIVGFPCLLSARRVEIPG